MDRSNFMNIKWMGEDQFENKTIIDYFSRTIKYLEHKQV